MPRPNYESSREVAEALANALEQANYRRPLRVVISTRSLDPDRIHWAFRFEEQKDASSHQVVELLRTSPVLPDITHLISCSGCGYDWFDHKQGEGRLQLGSYGLLLCGDLEKITIKYPQKGMTLIQMMAYEEKYWKKDGEVEDDWMDALQIGQRMIYKSRYTQHEWRNWECWTLEKGKAALTSLDGAPFIEAKGDFPKVLEDLERFAEQRRERR